MKWIEIFAIIVFLLFCTTACVSFRSTKDENPLQTVSHVDLNRYIGKWYEIARYPHRFQQGCVDSFATYDLRDDGKISVVNECHDDSSGKIRQARGKAWIVDKETNARLRVSFFWPFSGDYWIIDLGDNYEYAVVGHPTRKYLWILSRTIKMEDNVYREILKRLELHGYDITKLLKNS
ncbi:MAG: lipocalin family protein [Pseudomonadota bacterium]